MKGIKRFESMTANALANVSIASTPVDAVSEIAALVIVEAVLIVLKPSSSSRLC